jgi:ribosomal protein L32E
MGKMSNNNRRKINISMRKKINGKITKREEKSIDNMLNNLPDAPKIIKPRVLTAKQREKMAIQIKSVVAEYLDCFMVVGYTPEGMRTFIVETDTPLQQDALNNLIVETTESFFAQQDMLKHGFSEDDEMMDDDDF